MHNKIGIAKIETVKHKNSKDRNGKKTEMAKTVMAKEAISRTQIGKGAFINDVTQILRISDPPPPSVKLKWLFYLQLWLKSKS